MGTIRAEMFKLVGRAAEDKLREWDRPSRMTAHALSRDDGAWGFIFSYYIERMAHALLIRLSLAQLIRSKHLVHIQNLPCKKALVNRKSSEAEQHCYAYK